ncbi:glycosyltransferase [Cyclobacterium roseum]|uniref:glycosyltransferase n=1 Tax=Cyclobacterium roseum TaxID=2666137 RepID=UPI001390CFC4|nr:glycosyltransferase family 2 protein [Cyclobacterium roseum]
MFRKFNFFRFLVWGAFLSLGWFVYKFFAEVGIGHRLLYWLLTVALLFKLLELIFEWYHFEGLSGVKPKLEPPKLNKSYKVDMFTTACPGEPFEMIAETLKAMVAVRHPHNNYLCDEGDDPHLKQLCGELGVYHITRRTHENAKAGNINHALARSNGEFCVILDPDHVPAPDFLDKVLPYFQDPKIGYVQVVQAYKNQYETLIAKAAAEQTYTFYGPYMRIMGEYGTAQAIGANCTFRRKALESVGGHAPGLTEDMHTSMLLHAEGWESVYVPEIVSKGLVPSSLSAYYQQQLKWSRGTFDLWLNLFPKLFGKFSWKQKIHYGLLPLYYLFGFITLIDVAVPVYALLTGTYPWQMNPWKFFGYFTPLLLLGLLVRAKSQTYLHDPEEKGIHLLGGILRVGTWWIYILGFFYTLINKKVLYIPTPKVHSYKNEFLLSIPNLVIGLFSIVAAVYGLNRDWHPYSFLMAAFALTNGLIFLISVFISQSQLIDYVKNFRDSLKESQNPLSLNITYSKINKMAIPVVIFSLAATLVLLIPGGFTSVKDDEQETKGQANISDKLGGFYLGAYLPVLDLAEDMARVTKTEKASGCDWAIISTYLAWGDDPLPISRWQKVIDHGAIPMITWEPFTNLFEEYKNHPDLRENKKVLQYISKGHFDTYIDQMALALRDLKSPVFLRFAHEMDNPMYPWSEAGGNSPEEFKAAWIYIYERFEDLGAKNVSWVWSPWSASKMKAYFPYGDGINRDNNGYVDWIGLTALNYGQAYSDQKVRDFSEIYEPFADKIEELSLKLPVMLAEFGSTSYGIDPVQWNREALVRIKSSHPEINALVFFYSNKDKNWVSDWRPDDITTFIDWTFDISALAPILSSFDSPLNKDINSDFLLPNYTYKSNVIQGKYGNYSWNVDGKPFYVKGICYNTGHDWHEGFYPLTRNQLKHDFNQIKAAGANTIRRYEPQIYDKNIFSVAGETGLKIMYGFWFDPSIDYYKDKNALLNYEKRVLDYVDKYKEESTIIAWNIGNETWGLLKKFYEKPYLDLNRKAYLQFIETLAQKIHIADPTRPVLSSEEHDHFDLNTAVHAYRKYAPSLDVIGINSYYKENISELKKVFSRLDTSRPYMITEFGPKGYWNKAYGDFRNDSLLIERSSVSKGKWYKKQWQEYIQANKGFNLGGMAFSWRDRYEGTATWYGITDYKGRLKPAYYYLKSAWKNEAVNPDYFPELTVVGNWYAGNPGSNLWFSAGIINTYQRELSYDWEILDQETWRKDKPIVNSLMNNQFVEIRLPEKSGNYRIYVYATDREGNVVTASRPLLLK